MPSVTRLLFAPHLGWRDVAVAEALRITDPSSHTGILNHQVPVLLRTSATAAAMYERRKRLRNSKDAS